MEINYSEGWLPNKEIMKKMDHVADYILTKEGIDGDQIEISVSFVDAEEIKDLNRLHRNVDEVTDVLSFPQYESAEVIKREIADEEMKRAHEEIHVTLGDVVICQEKIDEQADYNGHSFERELLYLFTHSLLHLLNYDHKEPEDYAVMRGIENEVMDEIGVGRK